MKSKIMWTLSLVAALFLGFSANAGSGKTISKPVTHAADAQNLPEDSVVYMQGTLTQNLGDEMYVFTDASGNIDVEIDDSLMQGQNFTPNMEVIITATVDKDGNVTSLDVAEIEFVNSKQMSSAN